MTERVFIGNDAGVFKMRLSRPGVDARNAAVEQCSIHEEKQRPLMYLQQGYASVPPGGTVTVNLGRSFAFPPVVILKHESHQLMAITARLSLSAGTMQLIARANNVGSLVKYVVMAPQ